MPMLPLTPSSRPLPRSGLYVLNIRRRPKLRSPSHYFANTNHNLSLLSSLNCPSTSWRAFLDLDCLPSGCFYCFHYGPTSLRYCLYCVTDPPPKRYGPCPPIRSVPTNTRGRSSANDKIVESEVAPRFTSVVAARRSRPCPRAHPLLRIGDPSPYAPSPALPSVDPTVRRSYPLSSTSLNTVPKR
jgi:hypothetical protein